MLTFFCGDMSTRSLAVVFALSILRPVDEDLELRTVIQKIDLIHWLIVHF